jgi:phosphoribosyl-AMP cyclohydrolase / phosphoribosyl-ATP pyrophosphohydrolase
MLLHDAVVSFAVSPARRAPRAFTRSLCTRCASGLEGTISRFFPLSAVASSGPTPQTAAPGGAETPRRWQRRSRFSRRTGATRRYNRAVNDLKWDDAGLITAVAQDRLTGQVRMVAWMNREALAATLESGLATFYSRSRRSLWRKGETSGHVLRVHRVAADCDGDTLLLLVDPEGPSCHTGRDTCFFRQLPAANADEAAETSSADPFLLTLEAELEKRASSSAERSYTRALLDAGIPKISAKISEEAGELNAALAGETDERVASEAADVLYHVMVGLQARKVPWRRVIEVLARRAGQSGHAEKASRGRAASDQK